MRVAEAVRAAAQRLSDTSDTARLDAELLMAHALGVARSDLLLRHMDADVPAVFAELVERRAVREPMAHILGRQEFYGRTFRVTPDVLIPRGDSESVVEAALEVAPQARRVLDCGTGSGALLVTCLLELGVATGIGVDASEAALAVAQDNAQTLGLTGARARFLLRDWTEPDWAHDLGRFDLIIANPPYVEDAAELDPDVRDFEPADALFAGPEGLDDYRVLIPQLRALLSDGGIAVLEIGAEQAIAVGQIAEAAGFRSELRRDLGGRARTLILQ